MSEEIIKFNQKIMDLWYAYFFDIAMRNVKKLICSKYLMTTMETINIGGFLTEVRSENYYRKRFHR